jgi:hypothetical protein
MHFFNEDWCSLSWSPWVPLMTTEEEFKILKEPGVYRIKPVNENYLIYIGQTGRNVRSRLNELRRTLRNTDGMPWNDPHTAAPSLWVWHQTNGFEYDCSAACWYASVNEREGLESYLLYKYRQEYGESTLCNFGRFHKRYIKSTGKPRKNMATARKGYRLEAGAEDNPAGGSSSSPLKPRGKPGDEDWMGLTWNDRQLLNVNNTSRILKGDGLYFLIDPASDFVVYIGQGDCKKRLRSHAKKQWNGNKLQFAYCLLDPGCPEHHFKELENDLIGNFFEQYWKPPEYQFRNTDRARIKHNNVV